MALEPSHSVAGLFNRAELPLNLVQAKFSLHSMQVQAKKLGFFDGTKKEKIIVVDLLFLRTKLIKKK
jgi:hypothetical protein